MIKDKRAIMGFGIVLLCILSFSTFGYIHHLMRVRDEEKILGFMKKIVPILQNVNEGFLIPDIDYCTDVVDITARKKISPENAINKSKDTIYKNSYELNKRISSLDVMKTSMYKIFDSNLKNISALKNQIEIYGKANGISEIDMNRIQSKFLKKEIGDFNNIGEIIENFTNQQIKFDAFCSNLGGFIIEDTVMKPMYKRTGVFYIKDLEILGWNSNNSKWFEEVMDGDGLNFMAAKINGGTEIWPILSTKISKDSSWYSIGQSGHGSGFAMSMSIGLNDKDPIHQSLRESALRTWKNFGYPNEWIREMAGRGFYIQPVFIATDNSVQRTELLDSYKEYYEVLKKFLKCLLTNPKEMRFPGLVVKIKELDNRNSLSLYEESVILDQEDDVFNYPRKDPGDSEASLAWQYVSGTPVDKKAGLAHFHMAASVSPKYALNLATILTLKESSFGGQNYSEALSLDRESMEKINPEGKSLANKLSGNWSFLWGEDEPNCFTSSLDGKYHGKYAVGFNGHSPESTFLDLGSVVKGHDTISISVLKVYKNIRYYKIENRVKYGGYKMEKDLLIFSPDFKNVCVRGNIWYDEDGEIMGSRDAQGQSMIPVSDEGAFRDNYQVVDEFTTYSLSIPLALSKLF